MNSNGQIFEVDVEKKIATDIETKKVIALDSMKPEEFVALTDEQVKELKAMNREQRRAWFKENRYFKESR